MNNGTNTGMDLAVGFNLNLNGNVEEILIGMIDKFTYVNK